MSGRPDRWIGWTTTGCVALLTVIAGTVSYLHMHQLVAGHGQPGWVPALTPLSVDGMIVAASTSLLADSLCGGRGGLLPWALLVTGSVASLAANMAVAEPTATGRVIAAWPSFALISSYELLMRQIRSATGNRRASNPAARNRSVAAGATSARPQSSVAQQRHAAPRVTGPRSEASQELQLWAWQWARTNQASDGSLPSGKAIAGQYGRHERWGRLVKGGWAGGRIRH
jgi:Protein of unknown function (DUF2637)